MDLLVGTGVTTGYSGFRTAGMFVEVHLSILKTMHNRTRNLSFKRMRQALNRVRLYVKVVLNKI